MKSLTVIFIGCLLTFVCGCRKDDNPRIPDVLKVPIPLLILLPGSDTRISGQQPENFNGMFSIDVYFRNGEQPEELHLVVMKNGDTGNVKTVVPAITSWPLDFQITGQQLIDIFSEEISIGDFFEFSTDVTTKQGITVAAFPKGGGTPFAPGIYNLPGSSPVLRFAAPCPFNIEAYKTDFVVQRDDWGDYAVAEDISLTIIDSTHLSFKYKADDAVPIIMEIDRATNAITVANQKYGTYEGDEYFTESISGEDSQVDPCTTSISVHLKHSTVTGTFDGIIVLTKK